MSSYEQDILRRAQDSIPTRPHEEIAAERAAIERRESELRHTAANEEYRALGRKIVSLLQEYDIKTAPILQTWTDKVGAHAPRQIGEGWFIASTWIYQGADYPMRPDNIGIDTEGLAMASFSNRLDQSSPIGSAIVNPWRMDKHHDGARYFVDNEDFKNGLGSVIAGNGPLHVPYPDGY